MSDNMRWRYGNTNPVVAAVESHTVIEIGDLLWLDGPHAKPASVFPLGGSFEGAFAKKFLGVAMERSVVGDVKQIRVVTTGVFEFDCPSGTYELGDHIGVFYDGETAVLANQRVTLSHAGDHAIARVAKREPSETGTILVDIRSTIMTGGVK